MAGVVAPAAAGWYDRRVTIARKILTAALVLLPGALALPGQTGNPTPDPNSKLFTKADKKHAELVRGVSGTVRDTAANPLEKAIVELMDLKTMKARSFITRPDGTYHFDDLNKTNDYELTATHHGVKTMAKKVSIYDTRKKVFLNFEVEAK